MLGSDGACVQGSSAEQGSTAQTGEPDGAQRAGGLRGVSGLGAFAKCQSILSPTTGKVPFRKNDIYSVLHFYCLSWPMTGSQ